MDLFERICDCIRAAGYSCRSYSGRSMYGRNCLGVGLDQGVSESQFCMDVIKEACTYGPNVMTEVADTIAGATTDSMGLGIIVYFPSVEWPEGREDDDE